MVAAARQDGQDGSRAEILRGAATCFMERGYHAASIDEVAHVLGSTKGRVYHHFRSKAELFSAVFRTGMEMNFAAVEPMVHSEGRAVDRWRRMAEAHVRQMMATKPFQRAVWEGVELHLRGATTPEQRSEFADLVRTRADYAALFRDAIEAARAAGDMRFEEPGVAVQLMFVTLNSPVFWYSARPGETEADRAALVRQIVTFAGRGLGVSERTDA